MPAQANNTETVISIISAAIRNRLRELVPVLRAQDYSISIEWLDSERKYKCYLNFLTYRRELSSVLEFYGTTSLDLLHFLGTPDFENPVRDHTQRLIEIHQPEIVSRVGEYQDFVITNTPTEVQPPTYENIWRYSPFSLEQEIANSTLDIHRMRTPSNRNQPINNQPQVTWYKKKET